VDIQEIWEEDNLTCTWKNNASHSRIDYIWTTRDIAIESTRFQNRFDHSISNSDHTILALTIQLRSIIHKEKESPEQWRSKSVKSKTIILDETSEEQWEEYKIKSDSRLTKSNLRQLIAKAQSDPEEKIEESINHLWVTFESLLVRTTFNSLSSKTEKKRVCPKNIVHKK
jgi:hypothetical protein